MIKRVTVRYFKRFEEQIFELTPHMVLAGPNNSGKTTLLQAIAVWNLALQKWKTARSGSRAKQRTGVPITRKDFTALPLREMNALWTNTQTALRKEELAEGQSPGHPRVLSIGLEGENDGTSWGLTFELRYSSSELLYVKPVPELLDSVQKAAQELTIVYVPSFSGIGPQETRLDRPYQDLLVGQGKAGDILRNLLLEIYGSNPENWKRLCQQIAEIFGYSLCSPEYEGLPFIVTDYLPGIPRGQGKNGLPTFDISSAGSGFHQMLLLLGFIYARPFTVLLLDEPDAHLHVVLQKQMYDLLRKMASERHCQLLIATHSEVLVDGTSPDMILSFYQEPHRLLSDVERERVREALKRLTAMDILLAEQSPGIIYVEGETDFNLLKGWAKVLKHPLVSWFNEHPFWHANQGRNPREARAHFFALRAIRPEMNGFLLLDGDNRVFPDREVMADGLRVSRWIRYEAESYLLHEVALLRFLEERKECLPIHVTTARNFLQDQLPPVVIRSPMEDHPFLRAEPASKNFLPGFFKAAGLHVPKNEYFLVAEQMKPEEIAPEVRQKLDDIAEALGVR